VAVRDPDVADVAVADRVVVPGRAAPGVQRTGGGIIGAGVTIAEWAQRDRAGWTSRDAGLGSDGAAALRSAGGAANRTGQGAVAMAPSNDGGGRDMLDSMVGNHCGHDANKYRGVIGADPAAQIEWLHSDPLLIVQVAWETLTQNWHTYLVGFVGQLGWLDTELPPAYHTAAHAVLAVALMATMVGLRGERIGIPSRLIMTAGLLFSAAGLFAIQYLTWTVPGHPTVDGVYGRYFLPLAMVGAGLLPAFGNTRLARLHDMLVVVGFPVVTLAVVMRAVVLRYYLG
jgi:hypothetical protein